MKKKEVMVLSNLGVLASKFNINNKSLKEFDESLRFIRGKNKVQITKNNEDAIKKLLNVINPVSDLINGVLSESTNVSENRLIDIIKERHSHDWPTYRKKILELNLKLKSNRIEITKDDFNLMNDIADALDSECTNLFHRMSER